MRSCSLASPDCHTHLEKPLFAPTTQSNKQRCSLLRCMSQLMARYVLRFDALGTSPRISRNSFGPFRSRRFRLARSSGVAAGSVRRSMAWPARSADLARPDRATSAFANPVSTRRRMASDRDRAGLRCLLPQTSIFLMSSRGKRTGTTGSCPVAGRPLFFCCFMNFRIQHFRPRGSASLSTMMTNPSRSQMFGGVWRLVPLALFSNQPRTTRRSGHTMPAARTNSLLPYWPIRPSSLALWRTSSIVPARRRK